MDCVAPLRRGGDAIHQCPLDAVALCFLLTCALLMTSSHSEGICFTYGTWFGVEGLIDAGFEKDHPCITKACEFLISKQKEDGGWGETFMSCVTRKYVHHPRSQVVNTAWAVLVLLKAGYHDTAAIKRGVVLLIQRQRLSGDWDQESISGVFNKNCMISYSNFKNIFPIWAIGRYRETYPGDDDI